MLLSNDIRGHTGAFIVNFNLFASLIFGLTNYLVWLAEKSLDSLISRWIHDH